MPGFVDFEDMPAVYSMARALVFPSRYESFGLPIVEAMACGCLVVTSTKGACPEVALGARQSGGVPPACRPTIGCISEVAHLPVPVAGTPQSLI
jgi:glycosyltransferase involved in cell wall biosynthesis